MNKELFCKEFCGMLNKTEQFEDLVAMTYSYEETGEYVTPSWWDPIKQRRLDGKKIDVTADSASAIIKDVLKGIE